MRTSDRPGVLGQSRGIAAMEFALLTPVMTAFLAGLYDTTQAVFTYRRVTDAAHQIAMIATEAAVQPDASLNITPQQALQAATAIYAMFPDLKVNAARTVFLVTLSSVAFKVDSQGNSTASTAWSVALNNAYPDTLIAGAPSLPNQRPCGTLTQLPAGTQVDLTSLPTAGMTALAPLVTTDVYYTWKPTFAFFLTGPITFHRLATLMPRTFQPAGNGFLKGLPPGWLKLGSGPGVNSQNYVYYDEVNPQDPAVCPGYALVR